MKKVGGSAGLAAMIKQRTELVQQAQITGQDVSLPPMIVASNTTAATQSVPPPSKNTYLPKTTSFNPSNKCYMCDKTVYKPEELIAVGHVWHDKCFTCGGKNSDGCGRTMKRDGYLDHEGQPYCNACYNKLFRTKGFGYSNSLNTDFGSKSNDSVGKLASVSTESTGSNAVPPAPPRPPAPPAPSAPAPPAAPAVASLASRSTSPPKPAAPAAPSKYYTPTNNATVHSNAAPKCTACAKTVYKMEEVIAVGRVWHNTCFTCGGTKGDGCKKTLTRDNYVDHDNQPYCNACYSKLFRPKGFGFGNTLNTDYGPPPPEVATHNTVLDQIKTFQKPKAPGRPSAAPPLRPSGPPPVPPAPPATAGNPLIIPVSDPSEVQKGTVKVGGKAGDLYAEAAYAGNHDEVDESEW